MFLDILAGGMSGTGAGAEQSPTSATAVGTNTASTGSKGGAFTVSSGDVKPDYLMYFVAGVTLGYMLGGGSK